MSFAPGCEVTNIYALTSIATDNILASYAARFQRDESGDGYRFFSDDYGDGFACSAEQRDAYVTEFTEFVEGRVRFQILWLIGLVIITIGFLAATTFWLEWQPVIDFMEREDNLFPALGAVLTALPLGPAFLRGHRLYQKPVAELGMQRVTTGRRHSTRQVLERRIRGMSDTMIGLMIVIPFGGIIIHALEINGGSRSVAAIGGFGVMFIFGCVIAVWKHRAAGE